MNPLMATLAPYKWLGIGVVLLALLAFIASDRVTIAGLRVDIANAQSAMSDHLREDARAALAQQADNQAESDRRAAAHLKAIDEKDRQLAQARADRVIADAATGRLRGTYAALVAASRQAASNPAAVASGEAAAADDLQAELFRRVLEIAGQYRDAAEDAIIRGELAEREYDALKPPGDAPP